MRLTWIGEFHGPSPISDDPVVVARITGEAGRDAAYERAVAALIARYPDWFDPDPDALDGPWQPGNAKGLTLAAAAAAHWARAALNAELGTIRSAGNQAGPDGTVLVWVGFHEPELSRDGLALALHALAAATNSASDPKAMERNLAGLWQRSHAHHPDFQIRAVIKAARERNIPMLEFLPGNQLWQVGWGVHGRTFLQAGSDLDSFIGSRILHNKQLSKDLFDAIGVETPRSEIADDDAAVSAVIERIGFPCAVKPPDLGGGRGVTSGVENHAEFARAVAHARVYGTQVLIEEHVEGNEFRLMVVHGRLAAAIQRVPPSITGDGVRSVRQLINEINALRTREKSRKHYLAPVPCDEHVTGLLEKSGLNLDSVLADRQVHVLRSNSNMSTGGHCIDATERLHPQVRAMAEQLAATARISACGIDYITTDITQPPSREFGAVIEFNAMPGLEILCSAGWREEDIGGALIGALPGPLPVDLIFVTPEALPGRLAALKASPQAVGLGWACGAECAVGEAMPARTSRATPWEAVRMALRNRTLEELRIICTAQDIQRHGLPVSRLRKVSLEGVSLPGQWEETLRRCTSF